MSRRAGVVWLVVIATVWGCSFVIIKQSLTLVSPLLFLTIRFALASLLVAGWLRGLTRTELVGGLALGFFFWVGFVFQTAGLEHTTPSRSAFITGLCTPLVPVVGFLVHRRVPSAVTLLAVLVTGIGMYLLTNPGGLDGGPNRGDLLTLGCAAAFAVQIVAAGHYTRLARPERLLALQLATTGALSLVATPVLETPRFSFTLPLAAAFAFLSVTAAGTFWLQLEAQKVVSPALTAIIFTLESLAAAATSFVVLGEILAPGQWAGGALILGGALLPFLLPSLPKPKSGRFTCDTHLRDDRPSR
jgi:drug/metabolite transporter (DMT)-like permease